MVFGTVGFMIGTGGTALISMTLGMGDKKKANELFSMLTYLTLLVGVIFTVLSIVFMRPAAIMLGATGQMLEDCVLYGNILQLALTAYLLQYIFQSFCITAEKPNMSLVMMVTAGVSNMILDALFVAVFRWGIAGAAIATAIAQYLGALIPLIYFIRPNDSLLRLGKCCFDGKALLRTLTNGSSELMSSVSMSLVSMLYNVQLLRYAGENGIAAYGVIMYVNFFFVAVFIGFTIGAAPIIGYNHGAENHAELKNMFRKCLMVISFFAVAMAAAAVILARPLSAVFVGYDPKLLEMTVRGFIIYGLSFLLCGFNIFGSSLFTALNNGLISAVISFVRTVICQTVAVLLLPMIFGLDGIWWAIVAAELVALVLTVFCFIKFKDRYHYL
jgi:putative MATE family efflux protein